MKKVFMTIALACMATASFGYIYVNWDATKVFDHAATTSNKIIATANTDTTKILWQLVYTTQTSAANPTMDKSTGDISYQTGDQVLATRTWDSSKPTEMKLTEYVSDTSPDATSTLGFNATKGYITSGDTTYKNENFNVGSGSVYAAIFQYLSDGQVWGNVTALTKPDPLTDPPGPPTDVGNWPTKGVFINALDLGKIVTPTEVPEPATMSLLGLGALAMVIRRKLRK